MPPVLLGVLGITLNPLTIGTDVASAIFAAVLSLFGKGASDLVTALLGFVTTTTDPVLSGGWWSASGEAVFERVLAVSGAVMAIAFMTSIVTACIAGDRSLLAKAVVRLPVAAIEMALLVGVTGALVAATDEVSAAIAHGSTGVLSSFAAGSMADAIVGTGIVGDVVGGLMILASLAIWAELLCRTALIYVAVMAGPLIFAASVHPSVRGLKKRYVEGALALICSKVVVAIAFATGSALLAGTASAGSFSNSVGALMEALTILLVACFAPFILLKLLIGAEGIVAVEGLERRPARAALSTAGAASSIGGFAGMVRGIGGSGGGSTSQSASSSQSGPGGPGARAPERSTPGSSPRSTSTPPPSAPPSTPPSRPQSRPASQPQAPSSGRPAGPQLPTQPAAPPATPSTPSDPTRKPR
jgi:hypothetical protein